MHQRSRASLTTEAGSIPALNQSSGETTPPPVASNSGSGAGVPAQHRDRVQGSRQGQVDGHDVGHESLVLELKDGDPPSAFEPERIQGPLSDHLPYPNRGDAPKAFTRPSRRQTGGQYRPELGRVHHHGVLSVRVFLHIDSGPIEQRQFRWCQLVSGWCVQRAVHAFDRAPKGLVQDFRRLCGQAIHLEVEVLGLLDVLDHDRIRFLLIS